MIPVQEEQGTALNQGQSYRNLFSAAISPFCHIPRGSAAPLDSATCPASLDRDPELQGEANPSHFLRWYHSTWLLLDFSLIHHRGGKMSLQVHLPSAGNHRSQVLGGMLGRGRVGAHRWGGEAELLPPAAAKGLQLEGVGSQLLSLLLKPALWKTIN